MQQNNWMATPSTSKVKLTSIPPKTPAQIFEAQPMRSILSTRPISAYVSSSTMPKQLPKSRALYDFTDQIQDLREKEVSLEKAKADFWLAAENQRHEAVIQDLNRQHETQTTLIKQQHESQLKMVQKEHQQEQQKLEAKCVMIHKQANDQNQADRDAFKAQLEHLKQDHQLSQQVQSQRQDQRILQIQAELREQLEKGKRDFEAEFKIKSKQVKALQRQKIEQQVQSIVSKLSDEHFEAIKQLRDVLKTTQEENLRLAVEYRDMQTRNRRQEDYIFELRQSLNEAQTELRTLKLPLVKKEKKMKTEIYTQTIIQTYSKETDVEGLFPVAVQIQETNLQTPLTSEELQQIIEYQRKQIEDLNGKFEEQRLLQELFFQQTKEKVLRILRQSHTQLQDCRKQLMQEKLHYDELAYMLTMLQPKEKQPCLQIVKIQE